MARKDVNMEEKKERTFTEKQVIEILERQKLADANLLRSEQMLGGYTAYNKIMISGLVEF